MLLLIYTYSQVSYNPFVGELLKTLHHERIPQNTGSIAVLKDILIIPSWSYNKFYEFRLA